MIPDQAIADALMDLAHRRGAGASFCPSEAARALATNLRPLMPEVRRVAAGLPLVATQKGAPVDPLAARGPIRLRLAGPAEPRPALTADRHGAQTVDMTWKPDGYTSLAPYLLVPDPLAVLAFCEGAFGAERLRVFRNGDRIEHAECRIDDTVLMMGQVEDGPPAMVHLYLPDPDAAFDRALDLGAEVVQPMMEKGDGDRRGGVRTACGTQWWLARQL